ncbi:MAG: tRNA (adenosine(37)-N6)-threonylcarbamoyltransferase complex transferase subunit TsaD [Alphaproteobacteria bacterium]|nr:tRNA (adenosine(37)-N6)-threonylcarbamoyltransferase complex transferase subunit TsaD [Alphaproteobacteria bacterium]
MTQPSLTLLGLESSCDETAAAVVRGRPPGPGAILSSLVASQDDAHAAYGGVVPEIAARAHVERMDLLVARALEAAGVNLGEIDAIAATAGPGLIGGVLVGLMTAKALALATGKPLVAVNHLEGHALTARLTHGCAFPYLLLLVSGGHCQILSVDGPGAYERLGGTIDDAAGEAFDKTAKLLGLGFPGGPAVEQEARKGDPARFAFPRPLLDRPGFDMSFAGLKTAVRYAVQREAEPDSRFVADIAASFQQAVTDILATRSRQAMRWFAAHRPNAAHPVLVVAGGVAANAALRGALEAAAGAEGFAMIAPPLALCTDNAAMIAWAGLERFAAGHTDPLGTIARARWPLAARA